MSTLYEKIGGNETIDRLITAFYVKVLSDPELRPFFDGVSIEKLKTMQRAFFQVALDGPVPDLKFSLFEAHQGRGIERKHLTKFTDYLVATLAEIGVPDEFSLEIYQRIGTYSNEILGDTTVDG